MVGISYEIEEVLRVPVPVPREPILYPRSSCSRCFRSACFLLGSLVTRSIFGYD